MKDTEESFRKFSDSASTDILIAGGGVGGCAAALAATRMGAHAILIEPTDWVGGQLTQQAVSAFDEHIWIEEFGCTRSYRELRNRIRNHYLKSYSSSPKGLSLPHFNPGNSLVTRLSFGPRIALSALAGMLAPARDSGKLILLTESEVEKADVDADRVRAIRVLHRASGLRTTLRANYFIDATETGELLPMTGTEFVTGAESKKETGEADAPPEAQPLNIEAVIWCFIMDYRKGENHVIEKPRQYEFWRSYRPKLTPPWPDHPLISLWESQPTSDLPMRMTFFPTMGRFADRKSEQQNLWEYRRLIDRNNFVSGAFASDLTLVNWGQNDKE